MKNKRKMVCSDFDGTIGTGERLKKDIEAINRFRAEGNLFGLVSGRNIGGLRYVREKAGVPVDFLMSDSGGSCYLGGDRPLFSVRSEEGLLLPLANFLMERGTGMVAVNHESGTDMLYYRHSDGREEYKMPRAEWKERTFPQLSGYFKNYEECRAVADELEKLFPDLTPLPNDDCLDIVPKGWNKAVGIRKLAEYYGVPHENIYTVGDNYNDLHMLDEYRSFVVENACPEVKAHATVGITPSVGEMLCRIMDGDGRSGIEEKAKMRISECG